MPINKKSQIYWYCQLTGWTFYIVVNSVFFGLSSRSGYREYLVYFLMLPIGIVISHAYRQLTIRYDVINRPIPRQLLYIVACSFAMSVVFFLMILAFSRAFGLALGELTVVDVVESVINFAVIFCLWSFIYFGFKYFQNYKQSEINGLKYLAASRESELNNLKAQLNPHFIFNCMNSIRALIDENPSNAKMAVTRLSNILRYTLQMEKAREIPLRNEIDLVKDFLELEKTRYEERLCYFFNVEPETLSLMIPPFIIQSQVENAIKHGISKLPGPGTVNVDVGTRDNFLIIKVSNTGTMNGENTSTGVGLINSAQRLKLLYGDKSSMFISGKHDLVVVEINIPLKNNQEKPVIAL